MSALDDALPILERVLKDRKQAIAIGNELITALDLAGWMTTDNDHLAMMRSALKVVHAAVIDPNTAPRDISSLTNRLQTLSKEVTSMEERARQEKPASGGKSDNTATSDDTSFDSSSI